MENNIKAYQLQRNSTVDIIPLVVGNTSELDVRFKSQSNVLDGNQKTLVIHSL